MPIAIPHKREFTESELAERARTVARLSGEEDQYVEEMKAATSDFRNLIKAKRKERKDLERQIREGGVEETVACDVYFDVPTNGMKVFWDPANMVIIKRAAMDSQDRQMALFDVRGPVPVEVINAALEGKDND